MHLSAFHNSDEFSSIMGHIKERMLCRDKQIPFNNTLMLYKSKIESMQWLHPHRILWL